MTKKNMEYPLPKLESIENMCGKLQSLEIEEARKQLMDMHPEKAAKTIQHIKETLAEEAMRPGLTVMQLEDITAWKQIMREFEN